MEANAVFSSRLLAVLRDAVFDVERILNDSSGGVVELEAKWPVDLRSDRILVPRHIAVFVVFVVFTKVHEAAELHGASGTLLATGSFASAAQHRDRFWGSVCQQAEANPRLEQVIDGLCRKLSDANVRSAMSSLANQYCSTRPLGYLFELLLVACEPQLQRARGVYFTPEPVIQYIVRSVDILLRRYLGFPHGLTSSSQQLRIIDPACGAGLFFQGLLGYAGVTDSESPPLATVVENLAGFDVVSICRVAASFILDRELARVADSSTLPQSIHLPQGNPLEQVELCERLFADRVPIIVGNPPYSNFGTHNRGQWIRQQLEVYKNALNERKHNLDDDYIKFLRWGQYWIDRAGRGVLAMITNNSYLTGLTHRQMRASLLESFDHTYVFDLHGSANREVLPQAEKRDENIFNIRQGVAICLFAKTGSRRRGVTPTVSYASVTGSRDAKLQRLMHDDVDGTSWSHVTPLQPYHFFVPRKQGDVAYASWPRMDTLFRHYVSGVQTKCDDLFVGFTREEVARRIRGFLEQAADDQFTDNIPAWLRRKTRGIAFDDARIRPYMVAPFDVRWVYYEPRLLGRSRHQVMRHITPDQYGLVFVRQTTNTCPYDNVLATCYPASDRVLYSAHGAPFVAPLFLLPEDRSQSVQSNFDDAYLEEFARRLRTSSAEDLVFSSDGCDPSSVFCWIYGLLHAPSYRRAHADMLRIEFPHIMWPQDRRQFFEIGRLGGRLLNIHLHTLRLAVAESRPGLENTPAIRVARGYPKRVPDGTIWLDRAGSLPSAIAETVWSFRVGGYQVIPRWLKQRQGHTLLSQDLAYFRQLVDTARQTRRVMCEIDACLAQKVMVWPG